MPTQQELNRAVLLALLDRAEQGGEDAVTDLEKIAALVDDPSLVTELGGQEKAPSWSLRKRLLTGPVNRLRDLFAKGKVRHGAPKPKKPKPNKPKKPKPNKPTAAKPKPKPSAGRSHSGEPCKPGWSAARTGCTPKKPGSGGGDKKKPADDSGKTTSPEVAQRAESLYGRIARFIGGHIKPEHIDDVKNSLLKLTASAITALKDKLGLDDGGPKAELARKLTELALSGVKPEEGTEPETEVEDGQTEQPPSEGWWEDDESGDSNEEVSGSDAGEDERDGAGVAPEVGGSDDEGADKAGTHGGKSPGAKAPEDVPTADAGTTAAVKKLKGKKRVIVKKLKQYADEFRKGGNADQAEWMEEFARQIKELGPEAALEALGEEKESWKEGDEKVQYVGAYDDLVQGTDKDATFVKQYLEKSGIVLAGATIDPSMSVISSWSQKNLQAEKRTVPEAPQNYVPTDQTFANKLEESKALPGLESSEDIHKIVGSKVTHFTPEVIDKLDERFGKGQWIVKSYGEEAYAGFGIFFPQRAAAIKASAQALMKEANAGLKSLGYKVRKGEDGKIIGVSKGGQIVSVGTEEFGKLGKKVQRLVRQAVQASHAANGAALPSTPEDSLKNNYGISFTRGKDGAPDGIINSDGKEYKFDDPKFKDIADLDGGAAGHDIERAKEADEWRRKENYTNEPKFMVQPAFKAVGVSDADRAAGVTWETSKEGRVHVITRNGKAQAVKYATLMGRGDDLPATFYSDDTRAMEKAVEDAINQLPESERTGQMYAPDVMKTKDGWRVIELNPSAVGGGSDWLGQNPFVIDAVVSQLTNREPQHARFIRDLLKSEGIKVRKKPGDKKPAGGGGKKPKNNLPKKKVFANAVTKGKPHQGQPCKPGLTTARDGCIARHGSVGRTQSGSYAPAGKPGAIYTVKYGSLSARYAIHTNKKINGPSIPLPNYKQKDDHSCGFVAALTVGRFFNTGLTAVEVLKAVRPTKSGGIDGGSLAEALKKIGVEAEFRSDLTIKRLRDKVEEGTPVLLTVYPEDWSSDHWVAVQGFDDERIYLTNYKSLPLPQFKKEWFEVGDGLVCKQTKIMTELEHTRPGPQSHLPGRKKEWV